MRNVLLVLLCFSLIGCTTLAKSRNLEKQVADLEETLVKKNEDLKAKESQLGERDLEIKKLQKQLEGFGVFSN